MLEILHGNDITLFYNSFYFRVNGLYRTAPQLLYSSLDVKPLVNRPAHFRSIDSNTYVVTDKGPIWLGVWCRVNNRSILVVTLTSSLLVQADFKEFSV